MIVETLVKALRDSRSNGLNDEQTAIALIIALEMRCFSFDGNGWFDDDPEVKNAVNNMNPLLYKEKIP